MTLLAYTAAANCALGAKPVVYSYDLMALYKSVYHLLLLLRGPRMSEGIETVSCPSVCPMQRQQQRRREADDTRRWLYSVHDMRAA